SGSPRWRDQPADWEQVDYDEPLMSDDEVRLGALDPDRPGAADLFNFDEPEVEPEPAPHRIRTRTQTEPPPPPGAPNGKRRPSGTGSGRNVPVAFATGVTIGALVLVIFLWGPRLLGVALVAAALVVAEIELFTAFRQRGFHPAALIAFVGTVALCFG